MLWEPRWEFLHLWNINYRWRAAEPLILAIALREQYLTHKRTVGFCMVKQWYKFPLNKEMGIFFFVWHIKLTARGEAMCVRGLKRREEGSKVPFLNLLAQHLLCSNEVPTRALHITVQHLMKTKGWLGFLLNWWLDFLTKSCMNWLHEACFLCGSGWYSTVWYS